MPRIPEKTAYRLNEVCQYADVQPYVLRFWESEFPQLHPSKGRSGQVLYSRDDLELVLRIKHLLDAEDQTIADARELLENGDADIAMHSTGSESTIVAEPAESAHVARQRYDDAVDEIARLRLEIREGETRLRRVETSLKQVRETHRVEHERVEQAMEILEDLARRLMPPTRKAGKKPGKKKPKSRS